MERKSYSKIFKFIMWAMYIFLAFCVILYMIAFGAIGTIYAIGIAITIMIILFAIYAHLKNQENQMDILEYYLSEADKDEK